MPGRATLTLAAALIVLTAATARAEHPGGLLSAAEASLVADTYADQVKRCYFRHALAEPAATGQFRIDLQVRSDGGVADARVKGAGIVRRAFERCVVARALTWKFPASRSATEVRMPFRFHVPVRLRTRADAQSRRRKR